MKKPKSKVRRISDLKRATKRGIRLKVSREKIAKKRQTAINIRVEEKKKYEEFMKKLQEARIKGEF